MSFSMISLLGWQMWATESSKKEIM
jgi:hypothetical protein